MKYQDQVFVDLECAEKVQGTLVLKFCILFSTYTSKIVSLHLVDVDIIKHYAVQFPYFVYLA